MVHGVQTGSPITKIQSRKFQTIVTSFILAKSVTMTKNPRYRVPPQQRIQRRGGWLGCVGSKCRQQTEGKNAEKCSAPLMGITWGSGTSFHIICREYPSYFNLMGWGCKASARSITPDLTFQTLILWTSARVADRRSAQFEVRRLGVKRIQLCSNMCGCAHTKFVQASLVCVLQSVDVHTTCTRIPCAPNYSWWTIEA